MTRPIQSDGEAMPKSQNLPDPDPRDPKLLVLDAQNILSEITHLNEAIFLAAHGLGDRCHRDAISTVADIIQGKLADVESLLDSARGA